MLRLWNWSHHGLDRRKIEKFAPTNMMEYIRFVLWVTQEMAGNYHRIVFLDETRPHSLR